MLVFYAMAEKSAVNTGLCGIWWLFAIRHIIGVSSNLKKMAGLFGNLAGMYRE
jgi:hypothetical protein